MKIYRHYSVKQWLTLEIYLIESTNSSYPYLNNSLHSFIKDPILLLASLNSSYLFFLTSPIPWISNKLTFFSSVIILVKSQGY